MTDDDFGCMVTSMTNLFADKNCRDSVTVSMYVGNEEANTPFLKAEVRTAHGHDGKSLELAFERASLFPDKDDSIGGLGTSVAVLDDDGALKLAAAIVGFVRSREKK